MAPALLSRATLFSVVVLGVFGIWHTADRPLAVTSHFDLPAAYAYVLPTEARVMVREPSRIAAPLERHQYSKEGMTVAWRAAVEDVAKRSDDPTAKEVASFLVASLVTGEMTGTVVKPASVQDATVHERVIHAPVYLLAVDDSVTTMLESSPTYPECAIASYKPQSKTIVVCDVEMCTPTLAGVILFREGLRAKAHAEGRELSDVALYEAQDALLAALGGSTYLEHMEDAGLLLHPPLDSRRDEHPMSGSRMLLWPMVKAIPAERDDEGVIYDGRLDLELFGHPYSEKEKELRADMIRVAAVFREIDRHYTGDEAQVRKKEFLSSMTMRG